MRGSKELSHVTFLDGDGGAITNTNLIRAMIKSGIKIQVREVSNKVMGGHIIRKLVMNKGGRWWSNGVIDSERGWRGRLICMIKLMIARDGGVAWFKTNLTCRARRDKGGK